MKEVLAHLLEWLQRAAPAPVALGAIASPDEVREAVCLVGHLAQAFPSSRAAEVQLSQLCLDLQMKSSMKQQAPTKHAACSQFRSQGCWNSLWGPL